MVLIKTLILAFISTVTAFPPLVANNEPRIITRDVLRSSLLKRDFDPTIISEYDHPTDPLKVRQSCTLCIPNGCGSCGMVNRAERGCCQVSSNLSYTFLAC
ncbi:hypothetical protein Ptr902_10739 [Pyrenophora tritici-repentis]|nr:hypothetical protein Ptr902_13320 [Pyrenophora tritici-repentis]KAI2478056.1 hypothetical protein Ptr902_10739 [Pyrenophora tritici-repentis]